MPALTSYHEEADTRMVYHLHHIAQNHMSSNVTIRSNDTDVLIIIVYYMAQVDDSVNVWMDAGRASNNTRRLISINDLVSSVDHDILDALPGLHAFTGCDYTSSFMNKGKIRPLDLVMKYDELKTWCKSLGTSHSDATDMVQCERFVCHLYGKPKLESINTARLVLSEQTYAPKSKKIPLAMIKGVNPSSLPPCSNVLHNQLKRTNYIASMWKRAHLQKPCTAEPEGNGWAQENGKYVIDWYDGDQLPTQIYQTLNTETNAVLNEEDEDEDVAFGETMYGPDELEEDDDFLELEQS